MYVCSEAMGLRVPMNGAHMSTKVEFYALVAWLWRSGAATIDVSALPAA